MQHGTNSSQYYIIYFNFSKRVNLMLSVLNTHTHTHTQIMTIVNGTGGNIGR